MTHPLIGVSAWTRSIDTMLGTGRHHTLAVENVGAVIAAGGSVMICPPQPVDRAEDVVEAVDALVLSGGGDIGPERYGSSNQRSSDIDAERDGWELALVDAARRRGRPILGICRGLQVINVAMGGTLAQHVWGRSEHPDLEHRPGAGLASHDHRVRLDPTGRLARLFGEDERTVNSFHHQAVDRVGEGLRATATAGDGTVEGLESDDGLAVAVQWHPELMGPNEHGPLFADLLRRAGVS